VLRIQDLAVSFAGRELYRNVNLFVARDSRIGLVGPNGSGKSTLFRLLKRELEPDEGTVEVQRDLRIAHLPQTGIVLKERTVLVETLSVFRDVERIEEEQERLQIELARVAGAERNDLLERFAHLQAERDQAGYQHEAQARKMLAELGFAEADMDKPTSYSSGGFQVRVALAKLLLSEPDVLLLDEPTNYLDIKAIAWLQNYLQAFRGAYVLITHDRYLLDACVDRIWSIEPPGITSYKGNYHTYFEARAAREAQLAKTAELQQKEIEKAERFIEKFRARKDTARRVKSKQKMLERMEVIELPEQRKRIRFRFPEAATIYGQAVVLKDVRQAFGDKPVLSDVYVNIAGGERIALFGANGEGKTTLLRIIAGDLEPLAGSVWRSEKIQIAFYRQGAEELLDPAKTVIQEVEQESEGYTTLELRTILGAFLFPGDDIYKSVSVLSGGEKTRLALIKVLLKPSNLLLLDEPTNHLDITSREVLEEAIGDYRNTVVFAAHDRYMIDRLASKTVAVRQGHADVFPGNYTYAVSARPVREAAAGPSADRTPPSAPAKKESPGRGHDLNRRDSVSCPRPARIPRPVASPPPEPDPAEELRRSIQQKEARVRQLDADYEAAKAKFDFNHAREIWNERQGIIDEIIALRNQQ
jgi:ATP-binding cassette subfamily F protein 3